MSDESGEVRVTPERALVERAKKVVDACHHTSFAKVDPVDRHGACDACIAAFAAEYAREQVELASQQPHGPTIEHDPMECGACALLALIAARNTITALRSLLEAR